MKKIGVDTFIWTENFTEKDLWIIEKAAELGFETLDIAIAHPETFPVDRVKEAVHRSGIEVVTSTTLAQEANLISNEREVRENGVRVLKNLIDINLQIGSKILGGVNYAAWGYLTGKPRTDREWDWSVSAMRQVAEYAGNGGEVTICVEPVNRFETHFLNTAEDAVRYCREVGTDNVKAHLDTFHMIREELSFSEAVQECGKAYLGYVHLCENNRGIPGTGLVPWLEFFGALAEIEYEGPMVIESFDPNFEELNRLCAIWRTFAESGESLAIEGRDRLTSILALLD